MRPGSDIGVFAVENAEVVARLPAKNRLLGVSIFVERSVPVEVVWCEVSDDSNVRPRLNPIQQVQLKAAGFEDDPIRNGNFIDMRQQAETNVATEPAALSTCLDD